MSNPEKEEKTEANMKLDEEVKNELHLSEESVQDIGNSAGEQDETQEDECEKKWYVLRVQSGKEDKVRANLQKRVESAGMSDKIFQIVVPSELVSEIKKGFKRVAERKLYPGYVMVEMAMTEEAHYLVKSTPGVGDFAGAMSHSEVERMLMTCGHTQNKPKPKVSFREGQSIKIKEGAFENYDGVVDEVNEQKGIVKVRIGIFGRYTQVELGYWQVESL